MARKYHSPTSLRVDCERLWAYTYIDGAREPEVTWAQYEAAPHLYPTPGVKARALGVAVHGVLESWYEGAVPAWESTPGRVALSGAHLLPAPSASLFEVEAEVNVTRDGIQIRGYRDLRAWATPAEAARLGVTPDAPVTYDYKTAKDFEPKTTRDGVRYCSVKTAAELQADGQAAVYALSDLEDTGSTHAHMRWVYFRSEGRPAATHTDFTVTRAQAEDVVGALAVKARHLDLLTSTSDAAMNTENCHAYGRICPHHPEAGGTCPAKTARYARIRSAT